MQQVMDALRELQEARGIIPEYELAERARAILERSDMQRLDVADYLTEKGYSGYRLAQTVGTFGKAVKAAYREQYGHQPMKTHILVNGDVRPVNAYIEADRGLFDTTFEEWLS